MPRWWPAPRSGSKKRSAAHEAACDTRSRLQPACSFFLRGAPTRKSGARPEALDPVFGHARRAMTSDPTNSFLHPTHERHAILRVLRVLLALLFAIAYVLFLALAGYPLAVNPHASDWLTFALVLLVPIAFL